MVECASLENWYVLPGITGSNPVPSATHSRATAVSSSPAPLQESGENDGMDIVLAGSYDGLPDRVQTRIAV